MDPFSLLGRDLDGTHPLVVISTDDEPTLRDAFFRVIPGDIQYRRWTAVRGLGGARIDDTNIEATENPAAALTWVALSEDAARAVTVFYDLLPHLSDARVLRALKEAVERARSTFGVIVLVDRDGDLPPAIQGEAHRFSCPVPAEDELTDALRSSLQDVRRTRRLSIDVKRSTLDTMVRTLRGLTHRQAARLVSEAATEDDRFDDRDLDRMLVLKRNVLGDLGGVLEFVQAPVSMDEIGGLGRLKAWLAERSGSGTREAEAYGLSPIRGILLLGVQGAGKSLAAKAIATAWRVPLLRLDASALFDKFVGESERKLRDSLAQADRMAPAVLWIDEIEKGFASAASLSSDGGLSRRMFGTLLTWMQERRAPTFLAATANDVTSLPPELLRKGRFDEIFFVDLPGTQARRDILGIHLKRRKRDPLRFDLAALAGASQGFSGAELENAVTMAMYRSFSESAREPTTADLLQAIKASPPLSVVMKERVEELRAWAADRCVPAD